MIPQIDEEQMDRVVKYWVWLAVFGAGFSLLVTLLGTRYYFRSEIAMQRGTYSAVQDLLLDLRARQEEARLSAEHAKESAAIAASTASAAVAQVTEAVQEQKEQQNQVLKGQTVVAKKLDTQREGQLLTYQLFKEIRDVCVQMRSMCSQSR